MLKPWIGTVCFGTCCFNWSRVSIFLIHLILSWWESKFLKQFPSEFSIFEQRIFFSEIRIPLSNSRCPLFFVGIILVRLATSFVLLSELQHVYFLYFSVQILFWVLFHMSMFFAMCIRLFQFPHQNLRRGERKFGRKKRKLRGTMWWVTVGCWSWNKTVWQQQDLGSRKIGGATWDSCLY